MIVSCIESLNKTLVTSMNSIYLIPPKVLLRDKAFFEMQQRTITRSFRICKLTRKKNINVASHRIFFLNNLRARSPQYA